MKKKIKVVFLMDGLVKCRRCGAKKLCPCTTPKGKERGPHAVRIKAAEKFRVETQI